MKGIGCCKICLGEVNLVEKRGLLSALSEDSSTWDVGIGVTG